MTHVFCWRNNPTRVELHGKKCRILARGSMNSVLIEFENGLRVVTSRNAIRKVKQ